MKSLCKYCVKKPITVLMAILIIVVFGIFSLTKMSMALFPNLNLPYAVVVTTYPGANPETVEKEVSIPVEQSLQTTTNFNALTSTSNEHYSFVMVEFDENTNMDNAFLEMREALDAISFPSGANKPMIMRITADMLPIVTVSIARDFGEVSDEDTLIKTTQWIEQELDAKFNSINGVASYSYSGAADVVLSISLDSTKLATIGKTQKDVYDIINDSNSTTGLIGITLDTDGIKMLYIGDPTSTLDELNNLPIVYDGVKVIKLKDILSKDITYANNDNTSYNKINGLSGITVSFQQDSSAELTEVVKNISDCLKNIEEEYDGVQVIYILNQGEYVEQSIGTVVDNLVMGALLAVIILLIFLLSVRPTLIVAISIPVSVIATFIAMYFCGINLNIVSMGGLALGIGMLVDNSVVVIENIYRMISEGASKKEAAIEATKEVAGAITASTITTIAVFLPIMFLEGIAGSIFKEMSITICFSLLCSLIIAITLVPTMSARYLKDKDDTKKNKALGAIIEKINKNKVLGISVTSFVILAISVGATLLCYFAIKLSIIYSVIIGIFIASFFTIILISQVKKQTNEDGKIKKFYEKTLNWALGHKLIVIGSSLILFLGFGFLSISKGFILIPSTDEGSISGSITFEDTLASSTVFNLADKSTKELMNNFEDIEVINTTIGSNNLMASMLGMGGSGNTINYTITLKDDRKETTKKNREKMEEYMLSYLEMNSQTYTDFDFSEQSTMSTSLGTSGVQIYVEGNDLYDLEKVANKLVDKISEIDGVEKANNGISQGDDVVKINVVKEEAIKLGLYASDFQNAVNLLYTGLGYSMDDDEALKVDVDGIKYDISASSTGSITNISLPWQYFMGSMAVFDKGLNDALMNSDETFYVYNYEVMAILTNPSAVDQGVLASTIAGLQNGTIKLFNINPTLKYEVVDGNYVFGSGELVSSKIKTYVYSPTTNYTEISYQTGFTTISRNGKNRYLLVTAQYADGYNATKVGSKVDQVVNEFKKSEDFKEFKNSVNIYEDGENEQIMDAVKQLVIAVVVAIVLVYMIMCIQFQSLRYPLIVMSTIPLAFTGGFIMLLIANMELSMVALVGMVVLVGVVVNNGIVIIDYMNQLIGKGMPVKKAIIQAGKTRLRPIFMTALTTIFALITMALGIGKSSEIIQPMAVTTIGGLTYATILTLIVVPCFYAMLNRKKIKEQENE